ncbi:UDP-glucose 4-epimerase GalE [Acholeplasma sp. OttesenSCG-928-E16]|nr:UDP-glucose 4-epimerase GalE [Acholeplasma sp. OttesenSCG-928-E16]
MKVLVVGGAGYIGSHTQYELIKAGHSVVILDNFSTGHKEFIHDKAKLYYGDIRVKDDVDRVFENESGIDVVMHFAAKIVVPESVKVPLEYYHNNVEGVRVLLESASAHGVKSFVFSSTAAVYGEPSKGVCEETDIPAPINPYGETKLACERMIKWVCEAKNMNYMIFRYFNVAGSDESLKIGYKRDIATHLIPLAIESVLGLRGPLSIFGSDYDTKDGTCVRDYIHVSDLAYAHVLGALYLSKGNKSEIVNLGSSSGYTVLEVINEVKKVAEIKYNLDCRREGDPAILIASTKKAKSLLGFTPKYSLLDMISSELSFRKKQVNK